MEQEPSYELMGIQSHGFYFVAIGIIPPTEGHFTIVDFDNTVIADRYPMGISAEYSKTPSMPLKGGLQ